jgi:hypothetical protein
MARIYASRICPTVLKMCVKAMNFDNFEFQISRQSRSNQVQMVQLTNLIPSCQSLACVYVNCYFRFRGFLPWKKLVILRNDANAKAKQHHARTIARKTMYTWCQRTYQAQQARYSQAVQFHRENCVRTCWNGLKAQHARTVRTAQRIRCVGVDMRAR